MGRMICAICLAAALTAGCCVLAGREIDRAVDETLPPVEAALRDARAGQREDAMEALARARESWRGHQFFLQLLLPQSCVRQVDQALARCSHALACGEDMVFYSEVENLAQTLRDYALDQRPAWENLL